NSNNVDDTPIKPGPTCNKGFQAVLVLRKYIGDVNNLFAHKLEVMLGSFRQRT
ncbi:hypothetical protein PAXRUDRAFT_147210, partial [Paxillus rubicundulus Ve08.2h10]